MGNCCCCKPKDEVEPSEPAYHEMKIFKPSEMEVDAVPFKPTAEDHKVMEMLAQKQRLSVPIEKTRRGSTSFVPCDVDFIVLRKDEQTRWHNNQRR